jgi:hypothetical protein
LSSAEAKEASNEKRMGALRNFFMIALSPREARKEGQARFA